MMKFTVGPFAQADKDVEDFGMNIYFSYVFDESLVKPKDIIEDEEENPNN